LKVRANILFDKLYKFLDNETEKKILSRKSSNTIDNIINNVFDSAALNDNSWNYSNEDKLFDSKFDNDNNINNSLYDDGDDFELGSNLLFLNFIYIYI